MGKLQNNFTTPEQSKRLLELGAPRWSADEYRDEKGYRHSLQGILDVELFFQNFPDCFPCWSVGRLIEIAWICGKYWLFIRLIRCCLEWVILYKQPFVEAIIEYLFKTQDLMLDFSKLED